jgi:hypothetical protein
MTIARVGPQDMSVVLRYLGAPQREQVEGFAAIVADYLGSALEGVVPDIDIYERMLAEGRI